MYDDRGARQYATVCLRIPVAQLRVLLAELVLVVLAGCATRAKMERHRPAAYNAGAARTLTLVQVTGRPDLQTLLTKTLRKEASRSDWWHFKDASNERIALFPNAESGRAMRGRAPVTDEIFVRLDAYDATVFPEKTGDKDDPKDALPPTEAGRGRMQVRFAATVVAGDRQVLMREQTYAGTVVGEINSRFQRRRLVREAAEEGMEAFLDDITPRRVREGIVLDKEAEDMHPVAELVNQGRYAEAADRLKTMQARHPRRADIVYNLAVLADARGAYEEALALYERALQLGFKSFYTKSRDACKWRLQEREALSH